MALPVYTNIQLKNLNRKVSYPGANNFSVLYANTIGSRQARPIDRNLPYTARYGSAWPVWGSGSFASNSYGADNSPDFFGSYPNELALARNQAYQRMREGLYSQASVGTALAEYSQAMSMIVLRGGQLLRAVRSLRRGELFGALRYLELSPELQRQPKWRKIRSFSNRWLELHFGWTPLIKDIYDACVVISNPINNVWSKGRGKASVSRYSNFLQPTVLRTIEKWNGEFKCTQMCTGYVSNPNLHLATQMGLTNPLSIAWELVPLSFVVDWIFSVGDYLSSLSDFAGMTITSSYHTDCSKVRTVNQWDVYNYPFTGAYKTDLVTRDFTYMVRASGLVSPVIAYKGISLPSSTRAATAIALLGQQLKRAI